MKPTPKETARWRVTGSYLPTLASKTGLIEETGQFLLTYARLSNIEATRQTLANGGLPQRSRATRATIVNIVQLRLTRWHPPAWVLDDLITFAQDGHQADLQAALLLHTARQDNLLYDFIQQTVVPRWFAGEHELIQKWMGGVIQQEKSYPGTYSLPCVISAFFRVRPPSRLLSRLCLLPWCST